MKNKLENLARASAKKEYLVDPLLFRLSDAKDSSALDDLLVKHPEITVIDAIDSQLIELIKLRHPKEKFSDQQIEMMIIEHLGNCSREKYGVWVYYAWNNTLVHILDKDEFYEVKTNRNQHKITREESEFLSKQIVGVVGLSVGRTISVTMTMEHSYGEIRIADFDVLELSNYNRIRAGLPDLGVKKTVSLAREIAQIDPFVKVTCFHDGLTEDNIDTFFTGNGKLNALVDECDGLDIKILLREKAKALGIPVIMDMNDRGTMDIERFDLEPDRPLLHGLIGHLDSSKLKGLTNEQKIPYIMPMLGEQTISNKLRASMLEIEQTLTTWPQLAADVTLGGAVAANVYRRIILGEFTDSGRYFVDIDDLIRNEDSKAFSPFVPPKYVRKDDITREQIETLISEADLSPHEGQIRIPQDQLNRLVTAATRASSTANIQPWKWAYVKDTLFLFHDAEVAQSFGDFENLGSNISYGAAIENLIQQADSEGISLTVTTSASGQSGSYKVASIRFFENNLGKEPQLKKNLSTYINQRATNRKRTSYSALSPLIANQIQESAESIEGVTLKLFSEPELIKAAGELIGEADKLRFFNEEGHRDFFLHEARWSAQEAETTADGIDLRTAEMSVSEVTGMKMARNYEVVKQMKAWNGGGAFTKIAQQSFEGTSAIGLFCVDEYSPENALKVGRSLERSWLKATELGICVHPWMSIVFHFHRLLSGNGVGMDQEFKQQTQQLRKKYEEVFGLNATFNELFLVRFFHGETSDIKSLRKPLNEVLFDFRENEQSF